MPRLHPVPTSGVPVQGASDSPIQELVGGLIATHWVLGVCGACGHEQPHGKNHHAVCPGCGVELHAFALYRDLHAR